MNLILETGAQGFFEHTSSCATYYIKLVEYRKKLRKLDNNELHPPSENADDLIKREDMDQQCLLTCEKLYEALPAEHALKRPSTPIHLEQTQIFEAGAGDSLKNHSPHKESARKPNLPEFDGKNISWVSWKIIFEKESLITDYTNEVKFCHLLTAMKKTTMAYRIVRNYAGVENAFELGWKDLCEHFHSNCDIEDIHLHALRDLSQRFRITNENDFRPLEELYVTAQGHVKALEALKTDPNTYQTLAIMGLKESLPPTLRIKFFLEHDADDFSEVVFKELFKFLKKEVQARRLSWIARHRERGNLYSKPIRERQSIRAT